MARGNEIGTFFCVLSPNNVILLTIIFDYNGVVKVRTITFFISIAYKCINVTQDICRIYNGHDLHSTCSEIAKPILNIRLGGLPGTLSIMPELCPDALISKELSSKFLRIFF
jgi:hypothetical protein